MVPSQFQPIDDLLSRRDVKKAEILIAKHLRSDPTPDETAALLIHRARARLLNARLDDALDDLHHAREIAPARFEEPNCLELLADVHFARFELASVGFADRGDTVQAMNTYDGIVSQHPHYDNLGWVLYQQARVMLTENRVEDAVNLLETALNSPSRIRALRAYCFERLGFVAFYEQRQPAKALALLDKAIAAYPVSEMRLWLTQVHTLRARVLREMHEPLKALDAAKSAIRLAEAAGSDGKIGLADALLTAGEIAADLEGHEKDVIAFLQHFLQITRKPLGIDVTYSRVHEMLGDAYLKTSAHQQAVTSYQYALQFNPYHPWEQKIYYRMARAHYYLHEFDKAISTILHMIEIASRDGDSVADYRVYQVLGNSYYALGHYEAASEAYQIALEIAPPSADHLELIRQYHQYAQTLSNPV